MQQRKFLASFMAIALLIAASFITPALAAGNGRVVKFTVRIENISSKDAQTASDGSKWPFALSPGLWLAHDTDVTLFKEGKAATPNGIEAQAEDGNPEWLIRSLENQHYMGHGIFNTPVGASGPSPILPGGAYEFYVMARPGMKLTVITMFGQSNDWFYAPEKGIELFDKSGMPLSGDITSKFFLYDAGTEKDEEPGIGPNQAPRQKAPNSGAAQHGVVHKAGESSFFTRTGQLLRVTITPQLDESL
jgi:hypothetical protein